MESNGPQQSSLAPVMEEEKSAVEKEETLGFHVAPKTVKEDVRLDRYILDCKHWPDIVSKAQVGPSHLQIDDDMKQTHTFQGTDKLWLPHCRYERSANVVPLSSTVIAAPLPT